MSIELIIFASGGAIGTLFAAIYLLFMLRLQVILLSQIQIFSRQRMPVQVLSLLIQLQVIRPLTLQIAIPTRQQLMIQQLMIRLLIILQLIRQLMTLHLLKQLTKNRQ